jgi:hypothetical protein
LLWLAAAIVTVAAAVAVIAWPRGLWLVGAAAAFLSQAAIATAWTDARFGTIVNLLLLAGATLGFLTEGPTSFRARMEGEARKGLARRASPVPVTEADLAPLPEPVRRYLRAAGVVGRPRPRAYRVHLHGRLRSGPDTPWMPFEVDQQSFVEPPTRLFLMHASMRGLPVEAFHRLAGGHATMQVKALGAIPIIDAAGPELDRSEAVTLLNDLALLAPGALLEPAVRWEPVDDRTARARFTNGAQSITATLHFGADGFLRDFESDDRSRASPDGKTFTRLRFSTPIESYRSFGPYRLPAVVEARWHPPGGPFAYGEFEVVELAYEPG